MELTTTSITIRNVTRFLPFIPREHHGVFADLDASNAVSLGAVFGSTACGALYGEVEECVLKLRSLFVAEGFRGMGIATALLSETIGMCGAVPEIAAIHADFVPDSNGDDRLARLFERVGFSANPMDAQQYTITLGDISADAVGSFKSCGPDYVSFADLPDPYVREWNGYLNSEEVCPMALPIDRRNLIENLSFAYVSDLRVSGAVVVQNIGDNTLRLSWIFTRPELAHNAARVLINLIGHALDRALAQYPRTTHVEISAITDFSRTLTQKLCPGGEGRSELRAVYDMAELRRSREEHTVPGADAIIEECARQRANTGG